LALRVQAKDISDKYIDPPHTTDFAIMFLPTEGLYAEIVRQPGMFDNLQRKDLSADNFIFAGYLIDNYVDTLKSLDIFTLMMPGFDGTARAMREAMALGIPCVTEVSSFEFGEGVVTCQREIEGGIEVVEADLPAVLTITKGEYEPRYASLKGIMAAKRKPLEEREADFSHPGIHIERFSEPTTRGSGCILEDSPDAVAELVRLLREEANAL